MAQSTSTPSQPTISPDAIEEARLSTQVLELFAKGRLDQALITAKQVLTLREKLFGETSVPAASALIDIGEIYFEKKKNKEAEHYFSRGLDILEKQPLANPILLSNGLERLAHLEFAERNYDIAARFLERAVKIREDKLGKDSPALSSLLRSLANVYHVLRLPDKAEPAYVRALTIMEKTKGKDHADTVTAMKEYACLPYQNMTFRSPTDAPEEAKKVDETTQQLRNRADCWLFGFDTDCAKSTTPRIKSLLNGQALVLPKPEYPPAARAARAQGRIIVAVLIDENGNVLKAKGICGGPPALQQSSETAARGARFTPTLIEGRPTQVTGIITYRFVAF